MSRTILSSALFAVAANALGQAIVVNSCSYDVYMQNTPSADGGYSTIAQTLSSGDSYSQTWTALTNGNGWSIKLAQDNSFGSNLLQYEYTYQNDGTIWFDLSEVNGNPWDGNWEITANNGCSPRQAAYRFATDDAYGMQDCASNADITVTLCSGEGSGQGGPSSPSESPASSPAWTSTTTPVPSTPAPEPTTSKHHGHGGHHTWAGFGAKVAENGNAVVEQGSPAAEPSTTFSTSWTGAAVTVTNVHLETKTAYVTATAQPAKRHVHHARHPHRL